MHSIVNGNSPAKFSNKFNYISGGSKDAHNCNLYASKVKVS